MDMNTWDLTEQKHGTWWKDDLPTNEWKLTPKIHKRLTREVEHTGNTTAINIMTHEEDKPNTGRDTVKIKQKKWKKTPEPGKKQTWGHRSKNGRRKQWHDWTQHTWTYKTDRGDMEVRGERGEGTRRRDTDMTKEQTQSSWLRQETGNDTATRKHRSEIWLNLDAKPGLTSILTNRKLKDHNTKKSQKHKKLKLLGQTTSNHNSFTPVYVQCRHLGSLTQSTLVCSDFQSGRSELRKRSTKKNCEWQLRLIQEL